MDGKYLNGTSDCYATVVVSNWDISICLGGVVGSATRPANIPALGPNPDPPLILNLTPTLPLTLYFLRSIFFAMDQLARNNL
jgi:hypothetical protein